MRFQIPTWQEVDLDAFLSYWAARYEDPREELYTENIGRPLTPERIRALFKWKNGGPLAAKKRESIERNFIARIPEAEELPEDVPAQEFLQRFPKGGPIWRIFWMHCCFPDRFPIFDQHVHRAAARIGGWEEREIPLADKQRLRAYLEDYLPFWKSLDRNERDTDRALWTFGKFLKASGW